MGLSRDESFRVDQPQPLDIVGANLLLAGSGGGFEAHLSIRVLDANGAVLVETGTMSSNLTTAWQHVVPLPDPPPTTRGVVQVGPGAGGEDSPAMVSVPVYFGRAITPGYNSHFFYTVQSGDTLSSIAADQAPLYIGSGWQPIHEANRHLVENPDMIHPGTVLRLPSDF